MESDDLKRNLAALKRDMFLIKLMSYINIAILWVILLRLYHVI